jgi:hypothetical protein
MSALSTFLSLFTPSVPHQNGLCLLPRPAEQKKQQKGQAPKAQSDAYLINERTNTFGFRSASDAARTGAEKWLTGFDKSEIESRNLAGGYEVIQSNSLAKERWALGDSVAECARVVNRGESWVQKRYAAFSAALSKEREQNETDIAK